MTPLQPDTNDDAQLVERLKTYDANAVSEVVQRYGVGLHRYVWVIVGDHHIAEDIVSETYLRMLEHIGGYTYRGVPLRSWIYRIAHNLAVNAVARERRRTVELTVDYAAPPHDDPAHALGAHLEREDLRSALTELTDEQQQVVLLRFVEERSLGEVALLLAKSEGAVKQLQHRALRTLGRLLHRDADG